ncbi:hypothetical protein ADUPG1_010535 [Aduncisulcus paluster]|uniref:Uncharacterized protein n=1 Tax=Aduncisulcus paluster TaxID=2918883 RepID=A0ABQ5JRT5_9EUKA|nr:hypothetical protein ADUPG1_010535 [Aduncisulcus paluster]
MKLPTRATPCMIGNYWEERVLFEEEVQKFIEKRDKFALKTFERFHSGVLTHKPVILKKQRPDTICLGDIVLLMVHKEGLTPCCVCIDGDIQKSITLEGQKLRSTSQLFPSFRNAWRIVRRESRELGKALSTAASLFSSTQPGLPASQVLLGSDGKVEDTVPLRYGDEVEFELVGGEELGLGNVRLAVEPPTMHSPRGEVVAAFSSRYTRWILEFPGKKYRADMKGHFIKDCIVRLRNRATGSCLCVPSSSLIPTDVDVVEYEIGTSRDECFTSLFAEYHEEKEEKKEDEEKKEEK